MIQIVKKNEIKHPPKKYCKLMSFEKYGLNLYAILFLKRKILHKYACVKVCEETFPLWDRKT